MSARPIGINSIGVIGLVVKVVIPLLGNVDPQLVVVPAAKILAEAVLLDVEKVLDAWGDPLPGVVVPGVRPVDRVVAGVVCDHPDGFPANPKSPAVSKSGNAVEGFLWGPLLGSPQEVLDFLLAQVGVVGLGHSDAVLLPVPARGFLPVHLAIVDLWHTNNLRCRSGFGHCG